MQRSGLLIMNKWDRFIGKWRLFHGHCPSCNSDGPHIDTCRVCNSIDLIRDSENGYVPIDKKWPYQWYSIKETVAIWWDKYVMIGRAK